VSAAAGPAPRYRIYGIDLESSRPFAAPLRSVDAAAGAPGPDLRLRWHGPDAAPYRGDGPGRQDDSGRESGPGRGDEPGRGHEPGRGDGPGDRLWASQVDLPSGVPAVTLHRAGRRESIRYTEVVDFVFHPSGDRIDGHVLDPEYGHAVEIYLLGLVLAYWLEKRGRLALHGSGVVVDGSAVAFLGDKGSGKTSLAAAFLGDGCPLLTDDLLAVDVDGPRPHAAPGYPQLRMWPDLARHFVGEVSGLPAVEPGGEKRRVSLVDHWDAPFADAAAPLDRIYLPERREPSESGDVRIEDVRPAEGLLGLVRESFLVAILQATGLQGARLDRLGRLARAVPVRRLVYPSGLERLPEVMAAPTRRSPSSRSMAIRPTLRGRENWSRLVRLTVPRAVAKKM
jgi:hypothetical protein